MKLYNVRKHVIHNESVMELKCDRSDSKVTSNPNPNELALPPHPLNRSGIRNFVAFQNPIFLLTVLFVHHCGVVWGGVNPY